MLSNVIKVAGVGRHRGARSVWDDRTADVSAIPNAAFQIASHTGDAAFAIPPDYPLFARESIGISTASRGDARVILEPATVFTSVQADRALPGGTSSSRRSDSVRRGSAAATGGVSGTGPLGGSAAHSACVCRRLAVVRKKLGLPFSCPQLSRIDSPGHSARSGREDFSLRLASPLSGRDGGITGAIAEVLFSTSPAFQELRTSQPYDVNTLVVVHGRLVDTGR